MKKVLGIEKVLAGLFMAFMFVVLMSRSAYASTYSYKRYGCTDYLGMEQYNQILNALAETAGDDTSQSTTPAHATGITFNSLEEAVAAKETFLYLFLGEREFGYIVGRDGADGYFSDADYHGGSASFSYNISSGYGAYTIYVGWLPGSDPSKCLAEHYSAMETVQNIIGSAPEDVCSAYRYFNDWLCQSADYDHSFSSCSYAGYGALCTGSSVCAGYARAFMALCYHSGRYCITVSGTKGGGAHCWNAVWDGNTYKWVDVTWADQTGWIDYSEFMSNMCESWIGYFNEPFVTMD